MTGEEVNRLDLLCRVSQVFNSSLEIDVVLNRVIDEVIAATNAERGFLMLRAPDGETIFRVARGMDQQAVDAPEFEVSRSIAERVAAEGQPILTANVQEDKWLSEIASVEKIGLRSVMAVPLHLKGDVFGMIYVDSRIKTGIFSADDLDLLTAIASSAAIAIENARLYEMAVEKGRMEHELHVAREVQSSFIPHQTPHFPGWDFAASWQPAREVSGDFYDFIPLTEDQIGVVIADVSGKGMPAALFMALSRSTLRGSITPIFTPADCIVQANRLLCQDSANGMYVSLFYAHIEASGQITYVNAGHNPPMLYDAKREQLIELDKTGMVLGLFETSQYGQNTIQLDAGDFLLMYTDGVTEAVNTQMEEFGKQQLEAFLLENRNVEASEMILALEEALSDFSDAMPPFDDITAVLIRRT